MTISGSATTLSGPYGARVLADVVVRRSSSGTLARDAAAVVTAAGFVGLLAQIVIHLPFTPVPVTGQTLGVVLAGSALGSRRAAAAMMLYVGCGLAGLPWFQSHTSGWQATDGGYLLGFIVAATLCGWLAERGGDRNLVTSVPSMLIGDAVLFAIAVPWLAVDLHVGLGRAFALGCTPFLAGEAVKVACAAGLLPASWRILGLTEHR